MDSLEIVATTGRNGLEVFNFFSIVFLCAVDRLIYLGSGKKILSPVGQANSVGIKLFEVLVTTDS